MKNLVNRLRFAWFEMTTPPWRPDGVDDNRVGQIVLWVVGWAWVLGGIALGTILAPYLIIKLALSSFPYQDALMIGIALALGFLVQLIGWVFVLLVIAVIEGPFDRINGSSLHPILKSIAIFPLMAIAVVALYLPFFGLFYAYILYVRMVGPESELASTTFIGATLIKVAITFGIPVVKSVIIGFLLARFMNWVRDANKK